ncbi:hypothetical protein XENOCAPTIV_001575, partial [Xenoophorus captivus]
VGRRGGNLPLILCDTMGLEENADTGLNIDDVVSILKGHMKDRYQARQLSESLGIPLSYVLPVKNYSEELEVDLNTDILLFMVLEQMLNYADSFFENQIADGQDGTNDPELYRSRIPPDSVVLCVLATDDEEDVALQIHFTLLQSFCCDSSINILRVSGVQRLRQLLGGVDANQNQEEIGDLHCMLVTVGLL